MTPEEQYEEMRMGVKGWMYEYPIAMCDAVGERPGILGDGDSVYISGKLVATVLQLLSEETLSAADEYTDDYIDGRMVVLTAFMELMVAVGERTMPLTVPENFEGGL